MNKNILFIIVFLCSFYISSSQKKVLFIGNSLTAGMPEMLESIAKSKGDSLYTMQIGGAPPLLDSVDSYTREIINSKEWDYVVVQYNHQIKMINEAIKQNSTCTQTVSYMMWGWENGNNSTLTYFEQQDQFRTIYLNSANDIKGICAPAGMSWNKVRTEKPWLDLYGGDNYHPNELGMYLTACTFYSTFFENSPEGGANGGLPDSTATYFQKVAATIVLDSLETWNINVFAPNNTPEFISPIPNTVTKYSEVKFEWEKDESITLYEIQISTDKDFKELLLDKKNILEDSYTFDFNVFNTLVYVRLKGKYITQDQTECETSWRHLNIKVPYAGPRLLTPENNISCSERQLTFNWDVVKDVNKYLIQFSLDTSFEKVFVEDVQYKNSYSHKFINTENSIFWRVQSYNGHVSDKWSEIRHIALKDLGPNTLNPTNNSINISNSSTTLSWENYNLDSKPNYRLQVSKNNLFDDLVIDAEGLTVNEFEFKSTGFETKYYWRVLNNSLECPTAWSDIHTFKTKLQPTKLSSPSNKAIRITLTPTLEWLSKSNLASHQIVISTDSNFKDLVYMEDNIKSSEIKLQELLPLTKYYWKINTKIGEEICETSEIWEFITTDTPPSIPKLFLPKDATENLGTQIDFKWESVIDATSYDYEIAKDKDFKGKIDIYSDLDTNAISLSDLENNQIYFWRVKAVKNEVESSWSDIYSFSTKDKISSISLKNYYSKVYPNPNKGRFNIESEFKFNKIIIRNIEGLQIESLDIDITNNCRLELSYVLASGAYFLELGDGNESIVIRLVIE